MNRLVNTLAAIVVLLVIAGAGYVVYSRQNGEGFLSVGGSDMSRYSAVALTTNELFFGRIKEENSRQLVLEDVYFFTYVPDQQGEQTTEQQDNQDQQNLRPTLIDTAAQDSLAPTSTYVINREHVKYTYPLKKDSQVVKTIDEYKEKNQ